MGDPKKSRKRYNSPRNPWRSDQLSQELFLVGTYGLRNKRELWRAQTQLSSIRNQARALLAATTEIRSRQEPKLMSRLTSLGLVQNQQNSLDDVLSLTVENVLERRLQTLVWKRGLAKSPYQARQLITHGHVAINDRRITVPSYIVSPTEEASLKFRDGSSFQRMAVEVPAQAETPSSLESISAPANEATSESTPKKTD